MRFKITVVIMIFIITISAVVVILADNNLGKIETEKYNDTEERLSIKKITSDVYEELIKEINKSNKYFKNINIEEVEEIKDNYLDKTTVKVTGDLADYEFDKSNNKFYAYYANKREFKKCTLNYEEIEQVANKIFNEIFESKEEYNNYKLNELYAFDESIWNVKFVNYIDGNKNTYQCVNMSIIPEENEVYMLVDNYTSHQNNKISIKEKVAISTVKDYIGKYGDNYTIEIGIVLPNNVENTGEIYKPVNYTRNAYIITFKDYNDTKVYVDATTGKIIGEEYSL